MVKKVSKKGNGNGKKKFKIEVVDDHVQTVISLCQYLDNNGFETIQAYNGKEAIEKANKENPDLIVLDIRMEGLSGYDVARALPKKKVLFMSGFGFEDTEVSSFKNSIGFMEKPMNLKEMVSKIKSALKISE
jgi:two-component system OmpR family response regulator